MTIEMNAGDVRRSLMPAHDIDARMFRRVLDAYDRRQQLHVGAMRAQLITKPGSACFVIVAGRVYSRYADQPRGKVDDLIARPIDFRDDPISVHAVIV
jgi:hypothetical protein